MLQFLVSLVLCSNSGLWRPTAQEGRFTAAQKAVRSLTHFLQKCPYSTLCISLTSWTCCTRYNLSQKLISKYTITYNNNNPMPCPSLTSTFPCWLTTVRASPFLFEQKDCSQPTFCSTLHRMLLTVTFAHCPSHHLGSGTNGSFLKETFPDSLQQLYLTMQQWLFCYKFFVLFCLFKNIYYHLKLSFIYLGLFQLHC